MVLNVVTMRPEEESLVDQVQPATDGLPATEVIGRSILQELFSFQDWWLTFELPDLPQHKTAERCPEQETGWQPKDQGDGTAELESEEYAHE